MIGRLTRDGLPFANVVAAGIATANIAVGRTIDNLQLVLGGGALTPAMLTLIRVKANGKSIVEATGAQLKKLNAFRGQTVSDAFLDIQFADITGYNEFDRMVGALDTSRGIESLTAEVTIAGATTPTLKQKLHESTPQISPAGEVAPFAGVLAKILRIPYNVSTGGKLHVQLPFGANGALVKRIHLESNNNVITGVTVKQDSVVLHESTKAENDYENGRWKRTVQTNWYSIDFVLDGVMTKGWDTRDARSVELIPEFSGADSGFAIIEYLDVLGNL